MSLISLYEHDYPPVDPPWSAQFESRDTLLTRLSGEPFFDIVIVGGGIHGACLARIAAFNGLKTALFEMGDYAHATSSRSSKLAHGGFRYLQMGDLQQVLEGVRCREDLFEIAPHLCKPQPFFLPVYSFLGRVVIGIGMSIYDWHVSRRERRHRWVTPPDLLSLFGSKPKGGYQFFDGVMDDTRLVIEEIIAARQEGALCLNHARVDSMTHRHDDRVEVGVTDLITGAQRIVHAGIVVNCAGPWAPTVGRVTPQQGRVCYSRGTHLIFNTPWPHQAVIMPMPERGRYYFIIPYRYGGTLVGTTEREVAALETDPQPTEDETRELLERLARDVPFAGLTADKIIGSFAGLRTLPLRRRRDGATTSRLSRRHRWEFANGVLTLYGGKYTSATSVAEEALRRVFTLAHLRRRIIPVWGRPLPGAAGRDAAQRIAAEVTTSWPSLQPMAHQALLRFGGLLRHVRESENWADPIGTVAFQGEVDFVIQVEQASTIEDVLRHLGADKGVMVSDAERERIAERLRVLGKGGGAAG